MHKNNKKGFTIVELVIVIAVIAILAAVLIPTFANLAKRANISADTQLIRNLNTALISDSAKNGKHTTMQSALDAAEKFGYDVARINASATDNEILWDSANDVFCYFNADSGEVEYIPETALKTTDVADIDYWVIVGSKTAIADSTGLSDKYSSYVANYSGDGAITTNKGIDVGTLTNVTSITYDRHEVTDPANGQTVVIRTNGGTLTVNAPADTVKHYGEAQVVTLTAVGTSSYYEHGSVNLVDVKKGRLVITNDAEAEVGTIYLTATNDAYDGIILATQSGSELPDVVAREAVSNPTTGEKLVVTIQTNVDTNGENPTKTEEIYLYPESDVKEATNGYNVSDLGLLVVEAISNEAQTQAAVQITDAAVLESVKESNVTTKEEVTAAATEFAGGKGTQANPWLIVDYDTFQNVSNHYFDDEFHYWKCKDNLVINATDWTPVKLYGSIEGNGVVLNNLDNTLFSNTWNDRDNNGNPINIVKISNMTLNCNIFSTSSASSLVRTAADDLYVDNVDVHGQIVGYSVGGYVDYGSGNYGNAATRNWQVTFKDCENDAKLVAYGESIGGFIQHPYCDISQRGDGTNIADYKSKITIIDSVYTGVMCTNGQYSYLTYQGWQNNRVVVQYSEEFINLYGQDINDDGVKEIDGYLYYTPVTNTDGTLSFSYAHRYNQGGNYRPTDSDSKFKVKAGQASSNPENYGDAYTFTKVNGAATVKISFMINPNDAATESGSYTGTYVDETIDISALSNGDTFNTNKIKYWTIAINPNGATKTGVAGTQFNVVNSFYGKTHNGSNIYAVFYSSTGEVVGVTSVKVCDPVPQVYMRANGSKIKGAGVGTEYTYDTGVDLSLYDVKVQYVNRDDTWSWNYTADWTTDLDTSLYSVSGSTITIHSVEGVPCTASSWFTENGYGYGGSHQIINIVFTLKNN